VARVVLGEDDDEDLVVTPDRRRPVVLPLHQMQPNPANPRPSQLQIDEMATDLKRNGQLQNINVMSRTAFTRPEAKPELADQLGPASYVIVNGNRRFAAAEQAGLTALRYEIKDDWTAREIDEAVVRENIHRQDMNPMHLGRFLLGMLPRYNGSQRQLAKAISKTQPWVNQLVNLTKLHPALQEALESGVVRFKLARECTRLHSDLQPLLASGALPQDLAETWLIKERIKAEEQWERWQGGPPYLGQAGAEPQIASDEYPVFSPSGDDVHTNGTEPNASSDPAGPRLEGGSDPVPRETSPGNADNGGRPATGAHAHSQPRRSHNGFALRVSERSPSAIAEALRAQLTVDEIGQLVTALSSDT
jgi:ParB/RepB/Spo0J family partition protein